MVVATAGITGLSLGRAFRARMGVATLVAVGEGVRASAWMEDAEKVAVVMDVRSAYPFP